MGIRYSKSVLVILVAVAWVVTVTLRVHRRLNGAMDRVATGFTLNLNSANAADLELLPGVGPQTARRIVELRDRRGSLRSVDELLDVSGIGPVTLADIRPWVTCHPGPSDDGKKVTICE